MSETKQRKLRIVTLVMKIVTISMFGVAFIIQSSVYSSYYSSFAMISMCFLIVTVSIDIYAILERDRKEKEGKLRIGQIVKNKSTGNVGRIVSIENDGVMVDTELPQNLGQTCQARSARFYWQLSDFALIETVGKEIAE